MRNKNTVSHFTAATTPLPPQRQRKEGKRHDKMGILYSTFRISDFRGLPRAKINLPYCSEIDGQTLWKSMPHIVELWITAVSAKDAPRGLFRQGGAHLHIVALVIDVQLFRVFLNLRELGALLIAELQ